MRKEFESGLAKRIAGKKTEKRMLGKAWMALVLGAVLVAGSAVTVAAMQDRNGDGYDADVGDKDRIQDPLENPDCTGDCVPDCVCDCPCDCTCPDCPCCDGTA